MLFYLLASSILFLAGKKNKAKEKITSERGYRKRYILPSNKLFKVKNVFKEEKISKAKKFKAKVAKAKTNEKIERIKLAL